VAASVDTEQDTQSLVERCGIQFPVAYGLDYLKVSAVAGCFYEERRKILHGTGFVLRPDGRVALALYSTGPIGRLVWQDVLRLVKYQRSRDA
jgi:hypothetical protein